MNRLLLFASSAIAGLVLAASAAGAVTERGKPAADAPIVANLAKRFPTASEVYVNCPYGNAIQIEEPAIPEPTPAGPGFQCEFRVEANGNVVSGEDEVVLDPADNSRYILVNTGRPSIAPDSRLRCRHRPRFDPIESSKVFLRGPVCGYYAVYKVEEIEDRATALPRANHEVSKLLPPRFSLGPRREASVGLIVGRYQCRAHSQALGSSRLRQFAICTNFFGDTIEVTLDQEPLPRRG